MKIGFFTNTYLPNTYGSTTSIEYFRKGLEKLGHEVFVFAPDFRGYKDKNEKVFRYPALMWEYKIKYPLAVSIYPPFSKIIKELKLDIIHSHQPFSVGKDGLRQARKNNIPIIFTHHCRYEDYTHYVPVVPQSILKWHVKRRATIFANQCDRVITPTKEIKEMIEKRGVKKAINILPTGLDWEKFQTGDRQKNREKLNIKKDEICLLWLGRMEKEKNLEFLMDVAQCVLPRHKNVKLLFVGSGSEEKTLKKRAKQGSIEEKVVFAGLVQQNEIQNYYAASDIFLQTSLTETQGMSTTEALASGLAVIAIKATGAVDLIENKVSGLLIDNNQNDFVAALEELIIDEEKRVLLGVRAKESTKKYDYKEKAKELVKIYNEMSHSTDIEQRTKNNSNSLSLREMVH